MYFGRRGRPRARGDQEAAGCGPGPAAAGVGCQAHLCGPARRGGQGVHLSMKSFLLKVAIYGKMAKLMRVYTYRYQQESAHTVCSQVALEGSLKFFGASFLLETVILCSRSVHNDFDDNISLEADSPNEELEI